MKTIPITPLQKKMLAIVVIIIAFFAMVYAVFTILPVHENANPPQTWGFSVDWKGCIRPDTLKLISGESPYSNGCGVNPPWTYLLLTPIALFPPAVGAAVIFSLTYIVYAFTVIRAGGKPWMLIGIILSPFIFLNAKNGNIDWLPVLGYILPPQIGLFFVLMKPQLGAGIAIFWLVEAWRTGRVREVVRVFGPVTIAYLISFIIFGLWPMRLVNMAHDDFNSSLWPVGLIAGIPLLIYSLYTRNKFTAIAATPFLAPYINIHSYAVLLIASLQTNVGFVLMIAMSWLVFSNK